MLIKFKNWIIFTVLGVGVAMAAGQVLPGTPDIAKEKMAMAYEQSNIKAKYKMENASFIMEAVDENAMQTEIGDKTADKFSPEMTLRKWDDEVNFKIKYKHSEKEKDLKFELDGEKIKLKGKKIETHFYEMENGNYEFEIILLEKPTTNIVSFDIETKGLNFYYQPELTQEEIDDGAFRPENVIGSYAVYHSTKSNHILGQKNYMSGKAFHIYRPKIIDNAGTEVWGKLNITDNLLTVEIPQEFLDNAVYPIRHAAGLTFGCDPVSPGGSWKDHSNNIVGLLKVMPTDGDGNVSKMSVYAKAGTNHNWNAKAGIWNYSAKTLITNGVGGITPNIDSTTAAWYDMTYSTQPTVINNTNYYLGAIRGNVGTSEDALIAYDTGSSGDGGYESNNYAVPESLGYIGLSTYKFSIYCTYTSSGNGGEAEISKPSVIWFD